MSRDERPSGLASSSDRVLMMSRSRMRMSTRGDRMREASMWFMARAVRLHAAVPCT